MGLGQSGIKVAAPQGRHAASLKYDILTALGAKGCAGDKHAQRIALRLITLLTARYNWRDDSLTTGQREIAMLWSVDERTVKREMARLREMGWLVLKRPAARGRVACYGLGLNAILPQTAEVWANVGPDFAARMQGSPSETPTDPTVVPFPGGGAWGAIATEIRAIDPGLFSAWLAPLVPLGERDGVIRLKAPSRFHGSFLRTHHLAQIEVTAHRHGWTVELLD